MAHELNASSPLYQCNSDTMRCDNTEVVVVLEGAGCEVTVTGLGIDPISSNSMQMRWSFTSEEIIWDAVYEDVMCRP